jgi:hypothetical protein
MMEAARSSEMLVNFYQNTWHYNSEVTHLHTHHCENLKSFLDYGFLCYDAVDCTVYGATEE